MCGGYIRARYQTEDEALATQLEGARLREQDRLEREVAKQEGVIHQPRAEYVEHQRAAYGPVSAAHDNTFSVYNGEILMFYEIALPTDEDVIRKLVRKTFTHDEIIYEVLGDVVDPVPPPSSIPASVRALFDAPLHAGSPPRPRDEDDENEDDEDDEDERGRVRSGLAA
jgi:hypothetical protein